MLRRGFEQVTSFVLTCLLLAALACGGGGGGSSTPAPTTGTLALTVTGLPNILPPVIQVTGPGGFSQAPQGTQTFTLLAPGTYTIAASPSGTFLPSAPTQTATVVAGQTAAVTVAYVAQPVAVSVTPTNPKVGTGTSVQLSAVVTGTSNQGVAWSVDGGGAGGSVTQQGLYTAPNTPGVQVVRATSVADATKFSTATVTVSALGGFHISEYVIQIAPGGTWDYRAFDDNTQVTTVTWSVPAAGGTIDSTGHYIASANLGQHTISATNTVTGQTAIAYAVITSTVSFSLYGLFHGTHLFPCDGAFYYWNLTPAGVNRTVTFDIIEGPGLGAFHDMGWYQLYYPGATPGPYNVRATPTADPSKADSMNLVVDPLPAVPAFQITTGAPGTSRNGHRGALLADGRVVVAGGWGGNPGGYLGSLELYNPAAGTFAPFPAALATPRLGPTVAALDANRVLVCGGEIAYDSSADTAEIVNVQTGTVTPAVNAMRARRLGHQTTAITTGPHTGKLLVTGGMTSPYYYGTTTATADLFDPATLTFSSPGQNMGQARVYHTATRLADGRILLAGGNGNDNWTIASTAELFDPATGTFTPTTGKLADPRYNHAAVLLNNGKVLLIGGDTQSEDSENCELFDPLTGTFTAVAPMLNNRVRHTASLLPDGRVLVIGGDSSYRYHGTAEVYNPADNTWSYYGRMSGPRSFHMAVQLQNGKVLVSGELDNKDAPKAEISN